jgi:hypothetical protein
MKGCAGEAVAGLKIGLSVVEAKDFCYLTGVGRVDPLASATF